MIVNYNQIIQITAEDEGLCLSRHRHLMPSENIRALGTGARVNGPGQPHLAPTPGSYFSSGPGHAL